MKIKLDFLEMVALQMVLKQPGVRTKHNLEELAMYGLVEPFEDGYMITKTGRLILSQHTPYLNNGQNMKKPLGMKYSKK